MQPLRILLLVIFCGCASQGSELVSYDQSADRTTFVSPKLYAGSVGMSGGLASGHRVMIQAFASCPGSECSPSEVEIAFFNDSSADLNLDYRRIAFEFVGGSMNWEDEGRETEPAYYSVPRGEFIRVPVSRGHFELMANSPRMEIIFGRTGTTVIRMPHARREPLREMADSMGGRES